MSALAVALVLVSAVCHATWNLLAKRAGSEGSTFVWLMATAGTVLLTPVAVFFLVLGDGVSITALVAFAGSALLHTFYFVVLQRGYGRGDLSVVYPVARGTGPLLASVGAVLALGERPGILGSAGIVLISAGILVLGWPTRDDPGDAPRRDAHGLVRRFPGHGTTRTGLAYGLLTGVFIGAYTLWDGNAVGNLDVSPVLLLWATDLGRAALLLPVVARDQQRLRMTWAAFRWHALGGAALSAVAYLLVLTAMTLAPVTAVAPLREVSVLLGVVFGARLLSEGHVTRRLAGAATVAAGAAAIALS